MDPSTDIQDFDEAVTWHLARVPMTRATWDVLSARAKRKAFTVAGVARADVIADIHKAIDRAITKGKTLEEFKAEVAPALLGAWKGSVKNPAWRIETIFRTNIQAAYSAGRWQQMTDPAVAKHRPFGQFDAVLDNRITANCEGLNGKILPWEEWAKRGLVPPLHFNCRSTLRSLRASQVEKKGGPSKNIPPMDVQEGFGSAPDEGEWEPDLKKYPPAVADKLKERAKDQPKDAVQLPPTAKLVTPNTSAADCLDVQVTTPKLKKEIGAAIDAIDETHFVPKMPRIPIVKERHGKEEAAYVHTDSGTAVRISIRSTPKHGSLSILHEVGHFLDHQGHDNPGSFLSETSGFAKVLDTIKQSQAYSELGTAERTLVSAAKAAGAPAKYARNFRAAFKYLKSPRELWARAYAQWVATHCGNSDIKSQLKIVRARVDGETYVPYQWDDDDWKTLDEVISAYMKDRGWA